MFYVLFILPCTWTSSVRINIFLTPCSRIFCILLFRARENLEDLFDGLQNDGSEGRSCTPLGDYALVAETRHITSFAPPKDESSTSQLLLVLPLERTVSPFFMMSKRPPTPRPNIADPGSKRPRDGEVFRRPVAPDTAQGNPDSPKRSHF